MKLTGHVLHWVLFMRLFELLGVVQSEM